jgi:phage gp29-like protein
MPDLVDQYGRPIERGVLTQQIAGPSITGVRSPLTGYPADGLNPRRLANMLREADQGEPLRYMELAEQIEERDLHYAGVLGTRKRSVGQLPVTIDAASDDASHLAHADAIRDWLTRDELADEIFDMLDAIGKGWSFTEIVWDTSEGQWRPKSLEWRDPRWFRPAREDGVTPLLRGDQGEDLPLPPFKFIVTRIRAKSGLPVRSGLARLATWSWMFKAFTLRDWAIFSQTFGQPVRIGKYPAGATQDDKDTLYRAVANIAGDCAAIMPESMQIEFVESANVSSSIDLYEKRADWLDRQISKAVLGQTATTDAEVGGLGSGKEHRQVQEDIERADAKALAAILNRDLIRPWVDLEFGPQDKYPKLKIGREEEEDVAQIIDGITKLVPMGLRVQKSWANDLLGIPDPDPQAELLAAPAARAPELPASALPPPDGPRAPPKFLNDQRGLKNAFERVRPAGGPARRGLPALQAQNPSEIGGDAVDRLADQAETVAAPGADALIDAVRRLVGSADSLEEVRDGLLALDPQMPAEQLASYMRLALVMAELAGRADVAEAGA